MAEDIDTMNEQLVSFNSATGLTVLNPKPMQTKQEAYRHAAWIVACAEVLPDEPSQVDTEGFAYTFDQYLSAVEKT